MTKARRPTASENGARLSFDCAVLSFQVTSVSYSVLLGPVTGA